MNTPTTNKGHVYVRVLYNAFPCTPGGHIVLPLGNVLRRLLLLSPNTVMIPRRDARHRNTPAVQRGVA